MSQIKVTYFPIAGRAELTRLLLTIGGIKFEDERIAGPDFAARKPTLPLGQLPVIEVDGVTYAQSMAMARYAARLAGLYPTDALEALKVDQVVESLLDLMNGFIEIKWRITDETVKAEKTKAFVETTIPKVLGMIESRIAGKFLLGDKMSLADVHLFDLLTNAMAPTFPEFKTTAYKKIEAIIEGVKTNPNVAAYLAK